MRLNYGKVFQEKSKDLSMDGNVLVPKDTSLWPKDWKTIFYKEYERFNKIKLPFPKGFIFEVTAMVDRRSKREFKQESISLDTLSDILHFSCGESYKDGEDQNKNRRFQSSAGGRYPIEVYILNNISGEIERKAYHYNVRGHHLEEMWDLPFDSNDKDGWTQYFGQDSWISESPMIIIITAVFNRSNMKYGERGYRYAYLEAGAISQNIQNYAHIKGINSCILGGIRDVKIEEFLDLDSDKESLLIAMAIGYEK